MSSLFGCADKNKEEVEPLKDITGRWDVKVWKATVYAADGSIDYNTETPGKAGDYHIYNADKTFERHFHDSPGVASGAYTYTNQQITTTSPQQGDFAEKILTLTSTHLTFGNGKTPQKGQRVVVQSQELVKH